VQIAVRLKIPLIVWGAHQGIDQVGMYSHLDEVEMTRKYRKEHDLLGFEAEDLVCEKEGISEKDLAPYIYPHDKELEKVGVRGIYLNNYIRWDSKAQHEKMIEMYGYESREQDRTFDMYNDVDCFHYSSIHDYIKYIKFGYGKVMDHASREIRLKRLTREQGIELVKQNVQKELNDENLKLFLDWLGMTKHEFIESIYAFRDIKIWEKDNHGMWFLKDSVINYFNDDSVDQVRLMKKGECRFQLTPSREPEIRDAKYVLFGKGDVDGFAS